MVTDTVNDTLIRGATVWRQGRADMLLQAGRIAAVGQALPLPPGAELVEASGCLLLPGFVDAHAHLDKTLWGTAWHSHDAGPSLMDKIVNERDVLARRGLQPQVQATQLLARLQACGTTHVRTHADVAPAIGLAHLQAMLALRDAQRERLDLQIVAFPQLGVQREPGTLGLLDDAVREGADVLGGLDPMGVDHDPRGQLDGLFDIAALHGCGLDIHLHERGELGAATLEMIAARTQALGLRGKVAISHAFCLGSVEPARLDQLLRLLHDNDIAVMTHAASGNTPLPPLRQLHAAGIRLFTGSDGIRDTWSPLNNGDMLERAYLLAYRNGFRDDPGIELCLQMATLGGAQVMGAADYGLAPGCHADLVLLPADNASEAVVMHPQQRLVFKRGRVIARGGEAV